MLLFLCSAIIGCTEKEYPPPEFVYIAGESFQETVVLSASTNKVAVGKPIVLHATRSSNGFVKVKHSTLPQNISWWRREPPAFEEEVADNLRWVVSPRGDAKFNIGFNSDHTREVVFSKPGKYQLVGYSAVWGSSETKSKNVIEIEVVE